MYPVRRRRSPARPTQNYTDVIPDEKDEPKSVSNQRLITILMLVLVLGQFITKTFHMLFTSNAIGNVVFFVTVYLFQCSMLSSMILYRLSKTRLNKVISTTLLIYSGLNVLAELLTVKVGESLVTTFNNYYLSEMIILIFTIIISIVLEVVINNYHNKRIG